MPSARPELRRGRIIWAAVRDRRGHEKVRPVIILTPTADIREDEPLIVLAITTTFPDPPPEDHILLPWSSRGQSLTRLRKRSAAVLSWVAEVPIEDVSGLEGDVPEKLMIEILERLK